MSKSVFASCAMLLVLLSLGFPSTGTSDCDRKTAQEWDDAEARILREDILPKLAALPDYTNILAAFEKAIARDPAASPSLLALVSHADADVAAFAAAALGRFPSPEAASRLKQVFEGEPRTWVRIGALSGLQRMSDPEIGSLAARALSDPAFEMQVAGASTLAELGDSRYGGVLVAYYEKHQDEWGILEDLGCVGDMAGSTVVRDRLLYEANDKSLDFAKRITAAHALEEMGQADLVRRLLDRERGDQTHQSLGIVEDEVRELASKRAVAIRSQGQVDALLRDADLGRHRLDMWDHPIRAKFVAEGNIRASSDGPDGLPGTPDDLTTTEPYAAWAYRVFPEQYADK